MKLKTLKDLKLHDIYCRAGEKCIDKVLKQEAINYIKDLEEDKKKIEEFNKKYFLSKDKEIRSEFITNYLVIDRINHTINWIKHFFNITQEDLK